MDAMTRAPLIGRDAQLRELASAVGVDGQEAGVVLLGGDAGVGKTRLLQALAELARSGRLVVAGHCTDFGDSGLAYLPFTELLGALASEAGPTVETAMSRYTALDRLLPRHRLRSVAMKSHGDSTTADSLSDDDDGDHVRTRTELSGHQPYVQTSRADLFAAVHALFDEVAAHQPLLLVVEDAHWADQATRELLTYLFSRPFRHPVSLVVSYRSDDVHRRHPLRASLAEWARLPGLHRMQLAPLPATDVRRLLRTLHPAPLPEADVQAIVGRADGNAFFAEELLRVAEAGGVALPDDLASLLLVRLDQLDDGTRAVVRAAAVAGRRVSHSLLGAVLQQEGQRADDLDRALRQAVESNVLEPRGDSYVFRHALLAEAVYDDLLPGERLRLHAAYVAVLRSGAVPGTAAELARHARAARDDEVAVNASIEAGDEAMQVGAPEDAAAHYQVALELTAAQPVTSDELVVRAADALIAAGEPHRASKILANAVRCLDPDADPLVRVRLLIELASTAHLADVDVDPFELSAQAMALLDEPGAPRDGTDGTEPRRVAVLRADALATHAKAAVGRVSDDIAAGLARQALDLATAQELSSIAASAALVLARLDEESGDPESAHARLDEILRQARADGEVSGQIKALHLIGRLRYDTGDMPLARAAYSRATALATDALRPWSPYAIDSRGLAGLVAYVTGDWDDALRIVDVGGESPPPVAEAYLTAIRLTVEAGRGAPTARELVESVRWWWTRDGTTAIISGGAAIDLYGDAHDLDGALAAHDDVVEAVRRLWPGSTMWARIRLAGLALGQLANAVGRTPRSELTGLAARGAALVESAQSVWEAVGSLDGPLHVEAKAWRTRTEAEHARLRWLTGVDAPDEAVLVALWQQAVSDFGRFGHVFEVARCQARLAAVLHATGQAAQARELTAAAAESARRLGALPLLAELRLVGGQPARDSSNGATKSAAEGALTAREQEILALVAQGHTNAQIGRRLFISSKTVSVHVSNVMAKLGARGRTEAVAIARRDGVLVD